MTYDTAKALKDAGFPQGGDGMWDGGAGTIATAKTMVYIPTLEEIIAACGDKFGSLFYWPECRAENERWEACSAPKWVIGAEANPDHDFVVYGATPLEAVANLYISLYNKDNATKTNKDTEPN